jgi:chemotaxis protein MotD
MGNDSSLPSLDSRGRPFGTGRSPFPSFSRQVESQLETDVPVERLSGSREAGGARRARKNAQPGTRRGRRGQRPEEARAAREDPPSRRANEAQARAQRSERAQLSGTGANSFRPEALDSRQGAEARNFRAQLQARGESTKPARHFGPRGQSEASSEAPTQKGSARPTHQGQPGFAPLAPQAFPVNQRAVLAGVGPAPEPKPAALHGQQAQAMGLASASATDKPSRAATQSAQPEASAAWSESEAANRASAVMRQLRVSINPALRSATIQLAPADLGRLSIKLRVDQGRVHATVRAENAETLKILEHHLPELQAALGREGLDAESFDLALGFGQEQAGGSNPEAHAQDTSKDTPQVSGDAGDILLDNYHLARAIASRSGLDTYA